MDIRFLLQEKRETILAMAASHGAFNVRIYGTLVQGNPQKVKKVDFIVELHPDRTMLDVGLLAMDLRELLGMKVYVVPEGGLREKVRQKLLQEAVPI